MLDTNLCYFIQFIIPKMVCKPVNENKTLSNEINCCFQGMEGSSILFTFPQRLCIA